MKKPLPRLRPLAIAIVLGAIGIFIGQALYHAYTNPTAPLTQLDNETPVEAMDVRTIRVAGRDVRVSVASTASQRRVGLSGRDALLDGQGMLFVFEQDGYFEFWMKDMRFPIDIIWLSKRGVVVTIASDVSPKTFPHSFRPDAPSRFVIELPAGSVQRYGLKVGDVIEL